MTDKTDNRYRLYLFGLLCLCLILACLPVEQLFGQQLAKSLAVTLTVFAIARGLNAVISVAQGTEMSIEPMGVGVTLTPGQILDPLNDIIEQFSSILLIASASLGIQNIILILSDGWWLRGILLLLAIPALWYITRPGKRNWPLKLLIGLTLLRLMVPVLALTSYQLQQWLSSERHEAVQVLETTRDDVELMNAETQDNKPSWLENLRGRLDIATQLKTIKTKAEKGVQATVYLIAEFLLVSVLLPLAFIYLVLVIIRRIPSL